MRGWLKGTRVKVSLSSGFALSKKSLMDGNLDCVDAIGANVGLRLGVKPIEYLSDLGDDGHGFAFVYRVPVCEQNFGCDLLQSTDTTLQTEFRTYACENGADTCRGMEDDHNPNTRGHERSHAIAFFDAATTQCRCHEPDFLPELMPGDDLAIIFAKIHPFPHTYQGHSIGVRVRKHRVLGVIHRKPREEWWIRTHRYRVVVSLRYAFRKRWCEV